MIAYLDGTILAKEAPACVLLAGGVGYEVFVPERLLQEIPNEGNEAQFYIYTHVREQALQLYGFCEKLERDLFVLLLEANGVGPKVALAVLSAFSGSQLLEAIQTKNAAAIVQVPGIGKKTAERLVIDLYEKCVKRFATIPAGKGSSRIKSARVAPAANWSTDVQDALVALGYKEVEVRGVLQAAAEALGEEPAFDAALRFCLRTLANVPQSKAKSTPPERSL